MGFPNHETPRVQTLSNRNPLIERDLVASAILEFGGARALVPWLGASSRVPGGRRNGIDGADAGEGELMRLSYYSSYDVTPDTPHC
jgi:hypothetical protein